MNLLDRRRHDKATNGVRYWRDRWKAEKARADALSVNNRTLKKSRSAQRKENERLRQENARLRAELLRSGFGR